MSTALIIVDVQNDFISGSLAVPGGERAAENIAAYLDSHGAGYDLVVATQDWHVDPGSHWSDTPDFANTWPVHCKAGTNGAELHHLLTPYGFDGFFLKGEYSAAYSGFEGKQSNGPKDLEDWLHRHGVTEVDVCGIATDYCVKATALDAVRKGFDTNLLVNLTAAVADDSCHLAIEKMICDGVRIKVSP